MKTAKTLCLNMIVKNEMANLDRCLSAVADHIDCWVIGDTGSTDGTQDFIRAFFAARNIPGELHNFPFENFEQARNQALEHAYASTLQYDYLLFDDADMELVVEDREFRSKLTASSYQLLQRQASAIGTRASFTAVPARAIAALPMNMSMCPARGAPARSLVQGSCQRIEPGRQVRTRHPAVGAGYRNRAGQSSLLVLPCAVLSRRGADRKGGTNLRQTRRDGRLGRGGVVRPPTGGALRWRLGDEADSCIRRWRLSTSARIAPSRSTTWRDIIARKA